MKKFGGPDNYTPGSKYDDYKKPSIFEKQSESQKSRTHKKKKRKRKHSSSSDERSSDSDSDASDSGESEEKPKRYKKKKKTRGGLAKQKEREEEAAAPTDPAPIRPPGQSAQPREASLVEMFETPSAPQPVAPHAQPDLFANVTFTAN